MVVGGQWLMVGFHIAAFNPTANRQPPTTNH